MATVEATAAGWPMRGVRVTPPPRPLLKRTLSNVLILGGTAGQRASVAYAFHRESVRSDGPFVRVDVRVECQRLRLALQAWMAGTDPEPGSDLLRAAEGGSLFVDEVASLPQDVQRMMLALTRSVDGRSWDDEAGWVGRLLAGNSHPLSAGVAQERFSSALYDALDKVRVELPRDPRATPW